MDEQFLITGAARGLGLAMTRQLLERGCLISALVRAESDGLRELQSRHAERLSVQVADVSDEASIRKTFAEVTWTPSSTMPSPIWTVRVRSWKRRTSLSALSPSR
jgi:NAD(P)-dependent dehydrogenase (short-subunit alcohol dehydrogenase family)